MSLALSLQCMVQRVRRSCKGLESKGKSGAWGLDQLSHDPTNSEGYVVLQGTVEEDR